MGYFAQQSLDVLDPDLTIDEQLQKDFPQDRLGCCGISPARFSFRATTRQEDPRAVGRREDAARHGAHAAQSAEFPGARRADESPRSGDQGDADRGAEGLRGHDAVRVARPDVSARRSATACWNSAARAARSASRTCIRGRMSNTSSAPATKPRGLLFSVVGEQKMRKVVY